MNRSGTTGAGGGFIQRVRFELNGAPGRYPFTLPVVRHWARIGGLELDSGVTF